MNLIYIVEFLEQYWMGIALIIPLVAMPIICCCEKYEEKEHQN